MASNSPTLSKRVVDPDTDDIDALAMLAAAELRDAGITIGPATLAARLNVPLDTIDRQWGRLKPIVLVPS